MPSPSPSPSLILGPQSLASTRRYTVGPIFGPDGVKLATTVTLNGSEALTCRLWQGETGAVLVTITPTWLSLVEGTISLTISADALTALVPGRYQIDLIAEIGGIPLAVLPIDAVLDLADAPGSLTVAGRLCSAEDCRVALGPAFGLRADLPSLIEAASRAIEDFCGRTFAQAALIEFYDGYGRPRLLLNRPPVTSLTAVLIDGVAIDESDGLGWTLHSESGLLLRGAGNSTYALNSYPPYSLNSGFVWPSGFGNIEVQYVGGFLVTPAPIRQAAVAMVKYIADSTRLTGLLSMERIGDYEYSLNPSFRRLPTLVEMLCGPYVFSRF